MKKLTIDIGNTNTLFCFFSFDKVISTERLVTKEISESSLVRIINKKKENFFNKENTCIIISSVVPTIEKILTNFLKKKSLNFFFLRNFVSKFKLKTKIRNKQEIGDDRIVNMLYAKKKI